MYKSEPPGLKNKFNSALNLWTILVVCIGLLVINTCSEKEKTFIPYVDPFIGTDGSGQTFPGASLPFGMVQLSPDTRNDDSQKACAGYHYSDSTILGFSHTHFSGVGAVDYTDILFMPTTGKIQFNPGTASQPASGYRSRFDHQTEQATPGYYAVQLDDYGIRAELTSSLRAGFHRYTYPTNESANLIIDLLHKENDSEQVLDSYIHIVNDHEIEGYRRSNGWVFDHTVYFAARLSEPISEYILSLNEQPADNAKRIGGKNVKAALSFKDMSSSQLMVKVGISTVNIKGARKNLAAEIPDWDFDAIHLQAKQAWNRELSRIEIESSSEDVKTIFYTAMYHAFLSPHLYMDIDGQYRGVDHKIHHTENYTNYSVFSLWDTFRAWHPLMTIIDQKRTAEFINVFLQRYDETGRLPMWPLGNNYSDGMLGFHATSVISDAWAKGIRSFDVQKAYRAMQETMNTDLLGLRYYKKWGYIPFDRHGESISKTLEYSYNDWCVAKLAHDLEQDGDYDYFSSRAQFYKNVFDDQTRFFRGKDSNHNWYSPFNPFINTVYSEANAFQYTFVPHDTKGLIQLMGGETNFIKWLDHFFSVSSDRGGANFNEPDYALIGQYSQGNEPDHHMPHLYNYVGQPWKTQKIVRTILKDMYKNSPNGLAGNEDCGQMSAWYILNALGFYSFNPGQPIYTIGSPIVDEAIIHLENGKQFNISVQNQASENIYIQSMRLNGKPYSSTFLNHEDIMKGGEFTFIMGREANKLLGNAPEDYPPCDNGEPEVLLPWLKSGAEMFEKETLVSLACDTKNAKIFFTLDGSIPDQNSSLYTTPITISKSSHLKIRAFNQELKPSMVGSYDFQKAEYLPAVEFDAKLKKGLKYKYYERYLVNTPDLQKITALDSGICRSINLDNRQKDSFFAFDFEGLIHAPSKGLYTFYLETNDGSRLFIDGHEVIENDHAHIAKEEVGKIGLQAGYHKIAVKYLQRGGGKMLKASWQGPGIEKQEIPGSALFHERIKG